MRKFLAVVLACLLASPALANPVRTTLGSHAVASAASVSITVGANAPTGANQANICMSYEDATTGSTPTFSDSQGNTWVQGLGPGSNAFGGRIAYGYSINPTHALASGVDTISFAYAGSPPTTHYTLTCVSVTNITGFDGSSGWLWGNSGVKGTANLCPSFTLTTSLEYSMCLSGGTSAPVTCSAYTNSSANIATLSDGTEGGIAFDVTTTAGPGAFAYQCTQSPSDWIFSMQIVFTGQAGGAATTDQGDLGTLTGVTQ